MSSTVRIVRPEPVSMNGPRDEKSARVRERALKIRDAMASRSKRMDAEFPEALDLSARAQAALAEELAGKASVQPGVHGDSHWREILRGEYAPLSADDICRLASSARPEAGRAVDEWLAVVAEARGKALEPLPMSVAQIVDALNTVHVQFAEVATTVTSAAADGKYDVAELDAISRRAAVLLESVSSLVSAARAAKERA
jgi:hypothetical protein